MTTEVVVEIDLSGVTTDGERWCGKVVLRDGDATATAMWIGRNGSDMGELVDPEGDEALCARVDAEAAAFESRITDMLGSPSTDDMGTAAWRNKLERERRIHEAQIGRAA